MRGCKKEEVKVEKSPLFMCSFCKMTFKTRPQISHHFLKCFHSPYRKKPQAGGVKVGLGFKPFLFYQFRFPISSSAQM